MELSPDACRPFGIMGGTFDPIHYGHLAVAEQTRETLDLAAILFIPAGTPPHKRDRSITAASHRVAMVELAIADRSWFQLLRWEVERSGPSYTVDTLERLSAAADEHGREHPVFILSVEALAGLTTWRRPGRILELCRVAVVPRRGTPSPERGWLAEHFPGQEGRFVFLDGPDLGHSATDIRARASSGRSIRYLVPPAVEAYIVEHHLYSPAGADRGPGQPSTSPTRPARSSAR